MKKSLTKKGYYQHPLKKRFSVALSKIRTKIIFSPGDNRDKDIETEVSYIQKHVLDYGFDFYPEVYVQPQIERLEEIVAGLNQG